MTDVSATPRNQNASEPNLRISLQDASEGMAQFLLATSDCARSDRLWPAHFAVFVTNPLSLAYGACGSALFLEKRLGTLPDDVHEWIRRQPCQLELYAPGLYVGIAGIALSLLKLGAIDEACAKMKLAYRSPLLFEDSGIYHGAAGWGLVSLHFFVKTGEALYLEYALRAGRHLLEIADQNGDTTFWRARFDGNIHYGHGYGSTGVALFLAHLFRVTGGVEFREAAIRGLDYDLSQRVADQKNWQWRRFENDTLLYPYLIHGNAGIGSTLIRFSRWFNLTRYEQQSRVIAQDTFVKYAFVPSLFEGLAGIGEFMLDMHQFTADPDYLAKALDISETILWFRLNRPQGLAFPGRWLTRISCDYGTGSSGIGLFFERLLSPSPRLLFDLEVDSDLSLPRSGLTPEIPRAAPHPRRGIGATESTGINRFGVGNARVLRRRFSQSLRP